MRYDAVLYSSGAMALVTVVLSLVLIGKHRQTWTRPVQQANIVKIIAMAPLFAVDSFVGILELEEGETAAHVLDMVKECYEAVAIHAFLMLMYDICGLTTHLRGGDKKTPETLPEGVKGRELHVPFPIGLFFGHPHFDLTWLRRLRLWTLQFVVLRPILSAVDLVWVDLFPNDLSKIIGVLVTIALNVSVTTAFFALITFYHAFEEELAPRRPLAKFICIKGVVFFATWQGLVLKLLAYFGVLHEGHRFSVDEVELAWQDLLVCIEMGLLFTPLHMYAFPPKEFFAPPKGTEMDMKKIN